MNKLLIIFLLLFRVDGLWAQLTDVSNPEKVYDCKKEQPVTIDYSDTKNWNGWGNNLGQNRSQSNQKSFLSKDLERNGEFCIASKLYSIRFDT